MKALIVYYSMSGNVKQTAEAIAAETGADLLALYPVKAYPDKGAKKYLWGGKCALMGDKPRLKPYIFSADRYDTVIFGSPVWASSFTPPLRTFIEENRAALAGKRLAAFVCYMGSGDQKALKKLKRRSMSSDSPPRWCSTSRSPSRRRRMQRRSPRSVGS